MCVCSLTACSLLRGRVVVVRTLDVGVLGGVAHLQHGDILGVVGLLHIHVVAFALEGEDHIAVGNGGEAVSGEAEGEERSLKIYICAQ